MPTQTRFLETAEAQICLFMEDRLKNGNYILTQNSDKNDYVFKNSSHSFPSNFDGLKLK